VSREHGQEGRTKKMAAVKERGESGWSHGWTPLGTGFDSRNVGRGVI